MPHDLRGHCQVKAMEYIGFIERDARFGPCRESHRTLALVQFGGGGQHLPKAPAIASRSTCADRMQENHMAPGAEGGSQVGVRPPSLECHGQCWLEPLGVVSARAWPRIHRPRALLVLSALYSPHEAIRHGADLTKSLQLAFSISEATLWARAVSRRR